MVSMLTWEGAVVPLNKCPDGSSHEMFKNTLITYFCTAVVFLLGKVLLLFMSHRATLLAVSAQPSLPTSFATRQHL